MVEQVDAVEPIRPRQPPVVGRERERALLGGCLEATLAGQGGLVLVVGEAGIGKTTLVEDLARQVEAAGCLALWGRSYDLTVTPPYGPWIEVARRYQAAGLEPPFPAFLDDPEALAALGSQERLFAEVTGFFTEAAAQRAMVVLLDDLHWADQASLDLLRVLAREVRSHPILVVATYRSDELTRRHPLYQLIPLLAREARAVRLEVRPLDDVATRTLIESRYPLSPDGLDRLQAYLHTRSEGNPLYAGELLRTLEDDRVLVEQAGAWQLGDLERVRVPPLLRQVIDGRLGRLKKETRGLLEVAAVIGQEAPLELCQQVGGADDETLAAALEEGLEAHLLVEVGHGERMAFAHALMREALYAGLVWPRRRGLHRRVAEAVVGTSEADPDVVAHHFREASDPRAAAWLARAGERAERSYAWMAAAEHFEAVLALMAGDETAAWERAAILSRVAWLRRYAEPAQSLARMEEAARLAVLAGDRALAADLSFEVGMLRCYVGQLRDGLAAMRTGVAVLDGLTPSERARLDALGVEVDSDNNRGTLAALLVDAGCYEEGLAHGQRVLAGQPSSLAYHAGGSAYGDAWVAVAEARAALGHPDAARAAFARAAEAFRVAQHHAQVCWTAASELQLLVLPYRTDDPLERRRVARESEDAGTRASSTLAGLPPRHGLLPLLQLEGTWDEVGDLARGLRAYPAPAAFLLFAAPVLGSLARSQGDSALAWSVVRECVPDGPATPPGDRPFQQTVSLQRLAGDLALDAGDLPTARAWLEAHDRWLAWSGAVLGRAEGALDWARYHLADRSRDRARRRAEEALAHASEPRQPLALIAVHRFLGALDTAERHSGDAEAHLRESLAMAGACAAPFERALTLLELAGLRAAEDKPDEARELLTEVQSICEPLRAGPTLEQVAALEGRLAVIPHKRRPSRPGGLSEREVEVLRLVAEGMTDGAIAEHLFISPRTVGSHVASILNKFGVSSRAAAVAFAAHDGLL